jgi:pilus assembly protein Flp/PilA
MCVLERKIFHYFKNQKRREKMERIWKFIKDEDGLELSEYAVMGALVILAAAGTITLLGGSIDTVMGQIEAAVSGS